MNNSEKPTRPKRVKPKSDELAQGTIDALSANICVLDESGVVLFVNSAWRQFGDQNPPPPPNYGVGSNYLAICEQAIGVGEGEVRSIYEGMSDVIRGSAESYESEYVCMLPQTQRWFNVKITSFMDAHQKRIVVAHEDITDRKLFESALSQSERRLRQAQSTGRIGDWDFNISTRRFAFSDEMYKLFGRDPKLGPPSLDQLLASFFPQDANQARLLFQHALDTGEGFDLDARVILPGGRIVWHHNIGMAQTDESGRVLSLYGTTQDVTERKQAELSANEARRKYSIVADNTDAWEFWRGISGHFVYVSPSCETISGYSSSEFMRDSSLLERIIHPEDLPIYLEHLDDANVNRKPCRLEFRIRRRDGEWRCVEHTCRPLFDADQNFLGTRGSHRDVTERKKAEEGARRYNEQLSIVADTEHALASLLEPQLIHETLLREVQRLFPDIATIFISRFDSARNLIRAACGLQDGETVDVSSLPALPLQPEGKGKQSTVIHTKKPLIVSSDLEKSSTNSVIVTSSKDDGRLTQSAVYVPMLAQDQVLGLIQCQSYSAGRFSADDVRILSLIANTAAVSILNAGLLEKTQVELRERMQVEEALKASEERYRLLAERVDDIVWAMDKTYQFTYASPATEQVLGYTVHEVRNFNVFDLLDGPSREKMLQVVTERLLNREESNKPTEYKMRHKDGHWVDVEVLSSMIFDEEGNFTGIVGVTRDVSQRKRVEQEIRESNERFTELACNISDIFWVTDSVTNTSLYVSPAFELIMGLSYKELIEKYGNFLNFVLPEDRGNVQDSYEREIRGERTDIQYRIRRPDGSIRWIRDKSTPVMDETGKIVRVVGVASDITEQLEADERLRQSELRFRELAENIQEIFWVYDRVEHKHIYINPAYTAAYETNEEELAWNTDVFINKVFLDDRPTVQAVLEKQQRGEPTELEYRINRTDGSIHWLWDRSFPVYDENGGLIRTAGVATDITDRKIAESKLNRLLYDFKERVKELTALHEATRIFMNDSLSEEQVLEKLVLVLPPAWQYPEITAVRISYNDLMYQTDGYKHTPWMLSEFFSLPNGKTCKIELAYLEQRPEEYQGPFFKEEIYLFESLVEQTKSFLIRKSADVYIERRNHELNQLLEAGRSLGQALTPNQIYSNIYHYLKEIMPCDMLIISSFDAATELITCEFLQTAEGAQDVSAFPPIPLEPPGKGTQSIVIRSGQSLLLSDYQKALHNTNTIYTFSENGEFVDDAPTEEEDDDELMRSVIIVPLVVNGKTAGALQIFCSQLNAYDEDHMHFAEGLAFRVSAALSNAILFADLEKRVRDRTVEIETIRQRLELATRAAELGIWDWNAKTGELIWDDQMHLINRTDKATFTGHIDFSLDRVHPDDVQKMRDLVQALLSGTLSLQRLEYRIIRGDGTVGYLKTHGVILRDAEGKPDHVIGMVQDVTQEKQAEDALQESEATYRALFENAHDAIFLFDSEGVILRVNSRCTDLLGYSVDEIIGKTAIDFIYPSDISDANDHMARLYAGEYLPTYERKFKRKDGTLIETEINLLLIRDENDKPRLVQSVVRDITQRKKAEETLHRANFEMGRAMRMKDEFLASMSHELRTPLTGVLGLSEALQMEVYGGLNDKQKNAIANIESSGRHLLELINDILDISKIEAGKLELLMEPCSLKDICQGSMYLTKGMAGKKQQGIRFTTELGSEDVVVRGDSRRLKQVIVNLLSNAIKFTHEGGALGLDVKAGKEDQTVEITVWDEGIGIQAEDMHRIFQPFVQLDSSLARLHNGSGLGLALVKRLVTMHNGSIQVESEYGKGSRFTVTLPRLPAGRIKRNTDDVQFQPLVTAMLGETIATAMIVDDNKMNIEMLADFLTSQRLRVATANSAEDFLARVGVIRPDFILMDVQMPLVDGLEATRRLRALPDAQIANIPVIAITALAMPGDRENCLSAGANDYISKPVKLRELAVLIQKILGGKK